MESLKNRSTQKLLPDELILALAKREISKRRVRPFFLTVS